MSKKSNRLDTARRALAASTARIAALEAERKTALLNDDDVAAVKLFHDIETERAFERGHADKITLFEAEVARENADAAIKRQQMLIGRFGKRLADADALAAELQDEVLPELLAKFRRIIELREAARMAFAVQSSHANAAAGAVDGCAMTAEAVHALLSFELYRISANPLLGGVPGARRELSLPGSKWPTLQLQLTPERITPLAEKLKTASAFAIKTLREEIGGRGSATTLRTEPSPVTNGGAVEHDTRTPAERRLAALYLRQAELAEKSVNDPAADREYGEVVAEIAIAQSEIGATNVP